MQRSYSDPNNENKPSFADAPGRPKCDPGTFEQNLSTDNVRDIIKTLADYQINSLKDALELNNEITKLYQSTINDNQDKGNKAELQKNLSTKPKHININGLTPTVFLQNWN